LPTLLGATQPLVFNFLLIVGPRLEATGLRATINNENTAAGRTTTSAARRNYAGLLTAFLAAAENSSHLRLRIVSEKLLLKLQPMQIHL